MDKISPNKLVVILGPTASGKSDLAIKLAKLFNGEIVSADSRQVYRGMDIGSGKVPRDKNRDTNTQDEAYYSDGIRHYLLDVADPQEYFSVVQYQELALKAINDIFKKGKLPILCGGTGLYISAIIEGWQFPHVPPNYQLREELEKLNTNELFEKLVKLDPQRAATIDKNNRRRLIRALEILSQQNTITPLQKNPPPWDILILGIKKDKEELKKLIKLRLEKRLKEGMIKEVEKLKENGVSSKRLEDFGLEYRWINRYLEKKISYEEMVDSLYKDICHYTKRQMTWFTHLNFPKENLGGFNKISKINWITNEKEAIKLVSNFLSE